MSTIVNREAPLVAGDRSRDEGRRQEWRSGWPSLVGATGATAFGASLLTYTAGLFVGAVHADLGWSRTQIATGSTLAMLTIAVAMPVVGAITDRLGSRIVGIVGLAAYGVACLGLSLIPRDINAYYLMLVLVALVSTATSAVVFAPVVVDRFARSRGLALGILMSGTAVVMIPAGPLLYQILDHAGWRAGYRVLGLAALLVGLPCALLGVRRVAPRPRDGGASAGSVPGLSFGQTIRTSGYWKMLIASCTASLALGGFLNQFPSLLADKALPGGVVAALVSLFVTTIVMGRLTVGILFDRFSPPNVALAFLLLATGAALLLLVSGSSVPLAALSVAMIGGSMGAEADIQAYLAARQFGLKAFATIFGSYAMVTAACLGLGALAFGAIFDRQGSYAMAIIGSALMFLVAGLLFRSVGKPFDPSSEAPSADAA